jgi:hypothetical protein
VIVGERILVCGGRDYADQAMLFGALDMQAEQSRILRIIQGGASGADQLARFWCYSRKVRYDNYPADWNKHGKAAGPIRNQQMLDEGRPTMVFAFSGGRGTADMVRRAKAAGVSVHYFGWPA